MDSRDPSALSASRSTQTTSIPALRPRRASAFELDSQGLRLALACPKVSGRSTVVKVMSAAWGGICATFHPEEE
jgi:hypothetical protein